MSDPIISLFIDDELDLDNKIEFVEKISSSPLFKDETVTFLNQEKLIRSEVVERTPVLAIKTKQRRLGSFFRPLTLVPSAAVFTAVILMLFFTSTRFPDPTVPYRFVIYRPDVTQVEITGSFTGWERVPMERMGASGYWEITLELPREEHRFTYIVEGNKRFADPTILTREKDDFGSENSVLSINGRKV